MDSPQHSVKLVEIILFSFPFIVSVSLEKDLEIEEGEKAPGPTRPTKSHLHSRGCPSGLGQKANSFFFFFLPFQQRETFGCLFGT